VDSLSNAPVPTDAPEVSADKRRWRTRFLKALPFTDNLVSVIAGLLAITTFAAGAFGYVAQNERSERNALEDTVDSLERRRDDLKTANASLETEVGELRERNTELEEQVAELENPTTTTTGDPAVSPSVPPRSLQGVFLNELEPVAGYVNTEAASLGGVDYRNVVSLELRTCGNATDDAEFSTGDDYSRFTAKVGLNDAVDDPDGRWLFTVKTIDAGGERVALEQEIPYGQVVDLDISMEGVLRLIIMVQEIESNYTACLANHFVATWADPRLVP
jgi:cell division protein FtsB